MKNPRTAAIVITAAIMSLLLLLLLVGRLSLNAAQWPPHPEMTELVEIDEEFVELFEPKTRPSNPRPAYADRNIRKESTPAKAEGSDLTDAGEAAAPAPTVTSKQTSPLQKVERETPEKTGPDKKALEAERTSRRISQGISNAFKNSEEQADNTTSKGPEKGDSGNPKGGASDLDGTGQGTVGGGWIMPRYAKVSSHLTGSIELRAIVNKEGKADPVEQVGGKAPASGDAALVARCIAEVRRHRFTRTDDNAPERAVARIVYNFK
ncbi:MAG: hypothetical protein K2K22_09350 [Muribaculaceae bacterium]|nr:hypothetical protein [Muribaculaceae bacterium]